MTKLPDPASEWIHEGLPPINSSAQVWLEDGSVRRVVTDNFCGALRFTDCTHPLQNAHCPAESIMAWRTAPEQPQYHQQGFTGEYDSLIGGALGFA
jgi:hypothetical protein